MDAGPDKPVVGRIQTLSVATWLSARESVETMERGHSVSFQGFHGFHGFYGGGADRGFLRPIPVLPPIGPVDKKMSGITPGNVRNKYPQ
jgi:hypothetical protein